MEYSSSCSLNLNLKYKKKKKKKKLTELHVLQEPLHFQHQFGEPC